MAEVYYYLPAEEVENVIECGLKLSSWHDRVITIDGQEKRYIAALLNPKDDMEKFHSEDFQCVKLDLPSRYCYVADRSLYLIGLNNTEIMNLYHKTLIPIEQYIFGSYRKPECLVGTTVVYSQISILNKGLDSPILYDNSEELYLNNIIEAFREKYENFNDTILYYLYENLERVEKFRKIEDTSSNTVVFIDNKTKEFYVINKADIGKYL